MAVEMVLSVLEAEMAVEEVVAAYWRLSGQVRRLLDVEDELREDLFNINHNVSVDHGL